MEEDTDGEYVRHEDYAKLEQQRAALVEACQRAFDQTDRTARPTDWEMLRAALRAATVKEETDHLTRELAEAKRARKAAKRAAQTQAKEGAE